MITFEKDLGVWTTDKLESGLHCQKAEASANRILRMIRKAFYRMSGDLFMLYKYKEKFVILQAIGII